MKRLILICLLLGLVASKAVGTTHTAASVALSDVKAAYNLATDGDTVVIPAGSASWTSGLNVNKVITLSGAGIGLTVIRNAITASGNSPLLSVSSVASKNIRITGIEFQDAGGTVQTNGVVVLYGADWNNSTIRVDNCKFNKLNGVSIQTYNLIGVVDHCTFVSNYGVIMEVQNPNWGNVGNYGDNSWSSPSNFGTGQFLFIEDNSFIGRSTGSDDAVDSLQGARYVFRHNTCINCGFGGHGTESGGRYRGMRAVEGYNNAFSGTIQAWWVATVRSGVAIIHDNSLGGYPSGTAAPTFLLGAWRTFYSFPPWGAADGRNQWDINQGGGPFYTGMANGASSASSSNYQVSVSNTPWTTDQWAGYSIKRTSGSSSGTQFAEIFSNTPRTIIYSSQGSYPAGPLAFANGDTFALYKVKQALDQAGVSGGSLLSGDTPTPPTGWNNQTVEPCYEWNNTYTGPGGSGNIHLGAHDICIVNGTHYINNRRMPGYMPYTYPHPLVTGGIPAPTNLRVVH